MQTRLRALGGAIIAIALTASLASCGDEEASGHDGTVTLLTHNSWAVSEEVLAAFEAESGFTVRHIPLGNAAELTNQIVLTKDAPLGDVVFGIDNTFASRALDAGALQTFIPTNLSASATGYVLDEGALIPVTRGDVCINIDTAWFAEHDRAEPQRIADLIRPEFADLTVVLNPATSSPGLAFFLATIDLFGEPAESGWMHFWIALGDNGVRVAESWSAAYRTEFSGSGEGGTRPIIVSYSSSPAFTLTDDGQATTTRALLDGCFRQVEYAGILTGAGNVEGAQALIEFLVSPTFQADIPGQMWVYPIDDAVELPADWARFGPLADTVYGPSAADIEANRDNWIDQWTQIVLD
ncbi:MAG: thiamine ABC transporter substrate-binding protein [Promicromonosporaceae bacterium]|nr:thiamine ABC transporter substrate-binding protein [Promicromonosporaceae bacterium]